MRRFASMSAALACWRAGRAGLLTSEGRGEAWASRGATSHVAKGLARGALMALVTSDGAMAVGPRAEAGCQVAGQPVAGGRLAARGSRAPLLWRAARH